MKFIHWFTYFYNLLKDIVKDWSRVKTKNQKSESQIECLTKTYNTPTPACNGSRPPWSFYDPRGKNQTETDITKPSLTAPSSDLTAGTLACLDDVVLSCLYFELNSKPIGRKSKEKMSVIDLITRVDAICKKYDKYDVDKQKELNVYGDDAFARLYGVVQADLDAALQVTLSSLILTLTTVFFFCSFFGFNFTTLKNRIFFRNRRRQQQRKIVRRQLRWTRRYEEQKLGCLKKWLNYKDLLLKRYFLKKIIIFFHSVNCDRLILYNCILTLFR